MREGNVAERRNLANCGLPQKTAGQKSPVPVSQNDACTAACGKALRKTIHLNDE